jgi:hypothetical protein
LMEHAAGSRAVNCSGMDTKPDDPACVLIHDDQDPVCPQVSDSQRNKSKLQRLSFMCPKKVSQDRTPGV